MIKPIIVAIIAITIITGGVIILLNNQSPTPIEQYKNMDSLNQNQIIREPAVAGQFYPDNPEELSQMIDNFLNQADIKNTDKPQILIVPHAGYVFSGQTASYAFKSLSNHTYDTVIILGSSHNYPIKGLALYNGDLIKTPLGNIPINKDLIQTLTQNQNITINNQVHLEEHSLEVELPFLQKVLTNNWQVMLGLINQDDKDILSSISQTLLENIPNTLIVISSDLSHYPSYQDAKYSDQKILDAILTKNIDEFNQIETDIMSQNLVGLDTCACGSPAIKIGMLIANQLNLSGRILHYSNSGDSDFGDKDKVVGYGAITFNTQNSTSKNQSSYLNKKEQQTALKLVRNTLGLAFGLTDKKYTDYNQYPIFSENRGAFVTLHKNKNLRGCIGLIEPIKPLGEAIIEMSKSAAFNDPRFSPLTKEELDQIKIEISVLTPPQIIDDYKKIELGRHGVIVRQGISSGVFLPQVADDTGWTLEEFLSHLCQDKAGLKSTCYQDPSVELYIFEAQVFGE